MEKQIAAFVYQKVSDSKIEVAYNEGPNDVITPDMSIHAAAYNVLEGGFSWKLKTGVIENLLRPHYGHKIQVYIRASDMLNTAYLNILECPLARATRRALSRYKAVAKVRVGGIDLDICHPDRRVFTYGFDTERWNVTQYNNLKKEASKSTLVGDPVLLSLELNLQDVDVWQQ